MRHRAGVSKPGAQRARLARMPRPLAWALGALFVLALFLHAHGPLFESAPGAGATSASGAAGTGAPGAGFSESDARALLASCAAGERSLEALDPRPWFEIAADGLAPLGAASLALSANLWSDGAALGAAGPVPFRAENLLLLALAAAGAGVFLRRLIAPWVGDDHARAAAWATAVTISVHPLAYAAIGSLAARGDLVALALGSWAGGQFLRARQARSARAGMRAGALTLVAGFASPLALALPGVLAVAEFVAGRRYRPLGARVRTSAVTFAVYGLCAAVEPAVRYFLAVPDAPSSAARSAGERLALTLERLGVLALPVNAEALGFGAWLLAAALLVVALEGAFSAARSAPRLWTTILALGAFALCASAWLGGPARVQPLDFTHARTLIAGLFVAGAGLALASTALSGTRRVLVPAIVCTASSALGHVHARALAASNAIFDRARADVARALEEEPAPAAVLLVDLPARELGIAPLERGRRLDFLASPRLLAKDRAELERLRARASAVELVAAPTASALAHFARTERCAALRAQGIVVAYGAYGAHGSESAAAPARGLVRGDESAPIGARRSRRLPPPEPTTGTLRWFRDDASTPLDWDALTLRSVSARGPRETDVTRAPILGWSGSATEGRFEQRGVWVDRGGEPFAHFDVGASIDWLLAGRIRLAWPVGGWSNLSEADAAQDLPRFEDLPAPRVAGADWILSGLGSPLCDAAEATLARRGERGEWRLVLLDLETLEELSIPLEPVQAPDGSAGPATERRAPQAGAAAGAWTRRGEHCAWAIEYSAAGVVLVRSEGLVRGAGPSGDAEAGGSSRDADPGGGR